METLLDHHLATFDTWLHSWLTPSYAMSQPHYLFTVVTLLGQLDPKIFNWKQVSVILQRQLLGRFMPSHWYHLLGRSGLNMEFTLIVSKFLMDRNRAGSLWINSHNYANLATPILEILRDE